MVKDKQKQVHVFKTRVRNDFAKILFREGDFAGFASGTHQQEGTIIFTIGPSKHF